ncbi:hypothetical protein D3C87_1055080 [compost metagenome]
MAGTVPEVFYLMRLWSVFFPILLFFSPLAFGYGVQDLQMSPEGLETLFSHFKIFSDWTPEKEKIHRADFEKFMPRAQQILLVRDQLLPLLQAYQYANPYDTYASKMIEIFKQTFPANARPGDPNAIHVFFDYSTDGRFQVDGIEAERLAVNTLSEIRFNILGLMKKQSLSIPDTVQLWLHELSHFDERTPLEVRDKWVATVTQWTQERTMEINVDRKRKILALVLPAPRTLPETLEQGNRDGFWAVTPESLHIEEVKKGFLLLEQDGKGTRLYNDAYKGFQTFDNFIKKGAAEWDRLAYGVVTVNWPTVQVHSVKLLPNKNIQFEYTQKSNLYQVDAMDQRKFKPGSAYLLTRETITPDFPENTYRVEVNPETSALDIKRNYSQNLQDGDFEMFRVQDHKTDRYISLRLKLKDASKRLLQSPSIHLVGKDLKNPELLSFEIKKIRLLSNDEVLLHVKVPNRNLEISQLLIPVVDKYGRYSEAKILPSKPFSLFASQNLAFAATKIESLEIHDKQFAEDQVRASLRIQSGKKIVGVTVDLEHTLLALQGSRFESRNTLTMVGEGRKYFIKNQDLKMKDSILSFAIPEEMISQVKQGALMEKDITVFYTKRWRDSAQTLKDTEYRHVRAMWVHFADGTLAKVPDSKLPNNGFSFKFDAEKIPIRKCQDIFNFSAPDTSYADSFG